MEHKLDKWHQTPQTQTSTGPDKNDPNQRLQKLESEIQEQKQLRLQDAQQVEKKAQRIKEWVTNKLRELEEQNRLLREQNIKCNQQLDLLKYVFIFICLRLP
jgi:hypothetical protein